MFVITLRFDDTPPLLAPAIALFCAELRHSALVSSRAVHLRRPRLLLVVFTFGNGLMSINSDATVPADFGVEGGEDGLDEGTEDCPILEREDESSVDRGPKDVLVLEPEDGPGRPIGRKDEGPGLEFRDRPGGAAAGISWMGCVGFASLLDNTSPM